MIVLALDTSTDRAVLALADRGGAIRVAVIDSGRRHGRDLIPRLKELLDAAATAPGDVEVIAVGLGPGSYTGSRVGVTAAKTLAFAAGARLVGLNSLHAIGRDAPADAGRASVIADAQRGELYVADLVRPAPGAAMAPAAETRIEPLASWLGRLEPGTVVLGPALDSPRIRPAIPADRLPSDSGCHHPAGETLIAMAREAAAAGRRDEPWLLEPLYLRRSAAEDQWDSRIAASRG